LLDEWKKSTIVPIYTKADKIECSNHRGISVLSDTYRIVSNILLSRLTPYAEKINGDFDATNQLMIIYSAFIKYFRINVNTMKQFLRYL
jgi:hypothetical protein